VNIIFWLELICRCFAVKPHPVSWFPSLPPHPTHTDNQQFYRVPGQLGRVWRLRHALHHHAGDRFEPQQLGAPAVQDAAVGAMGARACSGHRTLAHAPRLCQLQGGAGAPRRRLGAHVPQRLPLLTLEAVAATDIGVGGEELFPAARLVHQRLVDVFLRGAAGQEPHKILILSLRRGTSRGVCASVCRFGGHLHFFCFFLV